MKSRDITLTVDVMCKWGPYSPYYRIYVDGELLTERTYIWDNTSTFVKEHIVVNLESGRHTLELEKAGEKWIFSEFSLENFTIDGKPAKLVNNQFTIE